MKHITSVLFYLSALLLLPRADAADFKHKLLYGIEAAACAASVADGVTTYQATALGARETNPFLVRRGTDGEVSWAKLIGFKAMLCAAPIGISVFAHRHARERNADLISLPIAIAATGFYSFAAVHNIGVIHDQRQINKGILNPGK